MPGNAEVAGYSFSRLVTAIGLLPPQPRFQFGEGQEAGWSGLAYTGVIFVSNPLTVAEYDRLYQAASVQMNIDQRRSIAKRRQDGSKLEFAVINLPLDSGLVWHVSEYYAAIWKLRNHFFFWDVGGQSIDETVNKLATEAILSKVAYRAPNEVPTGAGVCLPYAFIKDNGARPRKIAITFRLTDHPDVTVWLEDSSRVKETVRPHQDVSEEEYAIGEFWSQYGYSATALTARSIWDAPVKRKVTMIAEGLTSFVQITREDQTVDFGYFVVSGSDFLSTSSRFKIRLHVIREAVHAKWRGVEPIDEKTFINIEKNCRERPMA